MTSQNTMGDEFNLKRVYKKRGLIKGESKMPDDLEARLKREYVVYAEKERSANREPISEWRWIDRRLQEPTPVTRQATKPSRFANKREKMTKRRAKNPSRIEYMKYRKERISNNRNYLGYDQWRRSRGE